MQNKMTEEEITNTIDEYKGLYETLMNATKQCYIIKNHIPQLVDDNIDSIHFQYFNQSGSLQSSHILHIQLLECMSEDMALLTFKSTIEKLIGRRLTFKAPPK